MISNSEIETEKLGARLATKLNPGDVLWLEGDLGAGKTAFVRGLAEGLGVTAHVSSPTFSIAHEYPGPIWLFHFDLYRLSGLEELWDIGWEDYLQRGGICVVEWGQRVKERQEGYHITLRLLGDKKREIAIQSPEGRNMW